MKTLKGLIEEIFGRGYDMSYRLYRFRELIGIQDLWEDWRELREKRKSRKLMQDLANDLNRSSGANYFKVVNLSKNV